MNQNHKNRMMEYPVVGSSMAHSDRELRLHHGIQNRIPDAAASHDHTSVSKSKEKWEGEISGTVPFLDVPKYIRSIS